MKASCCWIFFLIILKTTSAQEILSGVINHYAVVEDIDYCENTLTLSNASLFSTGKAVLLIQMQGAIINTSNNASFGEVSDLRQAGKFERSRVAAINGNVVRLENALVNTYDLDGSVQLVNMPEYDEALVIDTLKPMAWNGTTGGVLAFTANVLELQAPIDASGKGFRGGYAPINYDGDCLWFINYSDYAYTANSIRAAEKGEGIAKIINNNTRGRGAQSNGGGGGNDHNASGGGGANSSLGGLGGINDNPSLFGCQGNFPGVGGKGFSPSNDRAWMGGGGGAGHANNSQATDGGAGGGIIIIHAGQIIPNGQAIKSNGQAADTSAGDGAGGGGGGGSIVLAIDDANNQLVQVEAKGGRGGDANNLNFEQCFGPGGGGGGGRLLLNNPAVVLAVTAGGSAGQTYNSASCNDGTNGASNGQNGSMTTFDAIPAGMEVNQMPVVSVAAESLSVCTGDMLTLEALVEGFDYELQWEVDMGNGFEILEDIPPYSGVNNSTLEIDPVGAVFEGYQFRVSVVTACFSAIYSPSITLNVIEAPEAAFTFMQAGATFSFANASQNADTYYWDFGDGGSSTLIDPAHTFSESGYFAVTLFAIQSACQDTAVFTVNIAIAGAPVAAFEVGATLGCAPFSVQYFNTSSGEIESIEWSFPGGTPSTSTAANPLVVYNLPGTYSASLQVSNSFGTATFESVSLIQVQSPPLIDVVPMVDGLTVSFVNNTQNADDYFWDFGDGMTTFEMAPSHTFAQTGQYEVVFQAVNTCGTFTSILPVTVGMPPLVYFFTENPTGGCAPMQVTFMAAIDGDYAGLEWQFEGGSPASSNEQSPVVLYETPGNYAVSLTAESNFPPQNLTLNEYIQVYSRPEPDFDFSVDGLTVVFTNLSFDASDYVWNFDDGNSSQEENPSHTYVQPGVYQVNLNASNANCSKAISKTVVLMPNALENLDTQKNGFVFPNPTDGLLYFRSANPDWQALTWRLYNELGQPMSQGVFVNENVWDLSTFEAGMYFLNIHHPAFTGWYKILKY
ncbi:MAG TPA: PKD domain-containing protein [Saprospiraceae bacterium]|nr:PKD domain-containing protein [Saprospiraceae bacterium]HMQ84842.1 PKD domain-containing protein [Saprospiraceae bacterium]